MLDDMEEILVLLVILGGGIAVALNWDSIKKLFSSASGAASKIAGAVDSVQRYYNGTEKPSADSRPGSALSGWTQDPKTGDIKPSADAGEGGGFGGGGGGAFGDDSTPAPAAVPAPVGDGSGAF